MAPLAAQVESGAFASLQEVFQSQLMRTGQVCYMNIIARRCAIWSGIITAEDRNRPVALERVNHKREKVGLWIVRFTYFPLRIAARRIKVSQRDPFQLICIPIPA